MRIKSIIKIKIFNRALRWQLEQDMLGQGPWREADRRQCQCCVYQTHTAAQGRQLHVATGPCQTGRPGPGNTVTTVSCAACCILLVGIAPTAAASYCPTGKYHNSFFVNPCTAINNANHGHSCSATQMTIPNNNTTQFKYKGKLQYQYVSVVKQVSHYNGTWDYSPCPRYSWRHCNLDTWHYREHNTCPHSICHKCSAVSVSLYFVNTVKCRVLVKFRMIFLKMKRQEKMSLTFLKIEFQKNHSFIIKAPFKDENTSALHISTYLLFAWHFMYVW